jgi:thioredoxin reductase
VVIAGNKEAAERTLLLKEAAQNVLCSFARERLTHCALMKPAAENYCQITIHFNPEIAGLPTWDC